MPATSGLIGDSWWKLEGSESNPKLVKWQWNGFADDQIFLHQFIRSVLCRWDGYDLFLGVWHGPFTWDGWNDVGEISLLFTVFFDKKKWLELLGTASVSSHDFVPRIPPFHLLLANVQRHGITRWHKDWNSHGIKPCSPAWCLRGWTCLGSGQIAAVVLIEPKLARWVGINHSLRKLLTHENFDV